MISLTQIESDLIQALKARDQIAVDTMRGLKVRIQNEKIAKMRDLTDDEIINLVKSEIKRRKEAAESFSRGGRDEASQKELREAEILGKYLPEQMSEAEVLSIVEKTIAEMGATPADFGKVMSELKKKIGQKADGGMLAKIVKEKLK